MITVSKIRHSVLGRCVRGAIHVYYQLRNPPGKPVKYLLPGGIEVLLYPEGEIAEFLTVQRFFEQAEMALTAAYLKPGMAVIDVGANIGVYSLLAGKLAGDTGAVWAFEPSLQTFQRLTRNLDLNGVGNV